MPRGGRVAACGAALALGCLCVGLLGGRASSSPSRSALLDGGAATLSGGEAWYAANKDYGTDGTEAGVNMVDSHLILQPLLFRGSPERCGILLTLMATSCSTMTRGIALDVVANSTPSYPGEVPHHSAGNKRRKSFFAC